MSVTPIRGEGDAEDELQLQLFDFAPIEAYRFGIKPGTPVQIRLDIAEKLFARGTRFVARISGTMQEYAAKPKRGQGFGLTMVGEVDSVKLTHVGGKQVKGTAEVEETVEERDEEQKEEGE